MNQLIIAIDPGSSGAICSIKNGKVSVINMPKDVSDLGEYFKTLIEGESQPFCFIERVQSWVSDQEQGGKRFGIEKMLRQYTELKTVMKMLGIPFHETQSRTWQKAFLMGKKFESKADRKRFLKEVCQEKFPQIKVTLKNCDALLILLYGNQEMQINRSKYINGCLYSRMNLD